MLVCVYKVFFSEVITCFLVSIVDFYITPVMYGCILERRVARHVNNQILSMSVSKQTLLRLNSTRKPVLANRVLGGL